MTKKKKKLSVKDVLKQIPEKELRSFVSKQLGIQEVLDNFMTEFKKYFMQGDSTDAYISQLVNAFGEADDDESGWINFRSQSHLSSIVSEVAEAAAELRDAGNYEGAIDIYFTILEYGIDCINHSDDSMGYLGMIMDDGIQGLHALIDPDVCTLDEDSRQAFMDRCWNSYNRNRKTYQEMCQYLKRASNIGGREQVKQARQDLQAKYKACRALIDELKNV